MTGITDPTEEYFKDGLWGWVTSAWVKLVATAGGLLKIQIGGQDADVTVKQTTPANLTPGIYGWDGTNWQKLLLDASYNLKVCQPTPANMRVGSHGYVNAAWHPNPIQIGYSKVGGEEIVNWALTLGEVTIGGAQVPAGEIWVVTNIALLYHGTPPTSMHVAVIRGGTYYFVYGIALPVSDSYYDRQTNVVMVEGDYMRCRIFGASAGDYALVTWLGYKVEINL